MHNNTLGPKEKKRKGHGQYQCQSGSTSLCLAKCDAVVHFGCHYYERFRSEISGDYFHAGCQGKPFVGAENGWPKKEGVVKAFGGLIELSPNDPGQRMHNDTQLNYGPQSTAHTHLPCPTYPN